MKKPLVTATLLGFAIGVFAQGAFCLNNKVGVQGGIATGNNVATETYYSGTAGFEIRVDLAGVNAADASAIVAAGQGGNGPGTYALLTADGFTEEATLCREAVSSWAGGNGYIALARAVTMPGVGAGQHTIALVCWNTGASSWADMLSTATAATRAGVAAFTQTIAVVPWPPVNTTT
jgi:hypothetical protein